MRAIAVPAVALTWWLACYLVGRDPGRPVLWRAAGVSTDPRWLTRAAAHAAPPTRST